MTKALERAERLVEIEKELDECRLYKKSLLSVKNSTYGKNPEDIDKKPIREAIKDINEKMDNLKFEKKTIIKTMVKIEL